MACIENIPPAKADSEMEEGEIVDDLDDLSDISSEEEFLLRQRLQVLENYNNVLERKKAKNSPVAPGKKGKIEKNNLLPNDLSEISGSDNEEIFPKITIKRNDSGRYIKQKKKRPVLIHFGKNKDTKKKSRSRKKPIPKTVIESSEESDDEYRNKRRKLANAVVVHKPKMDASSLSARLKRMFGTQNHEAKKTIIDKKPVVPTVPNLAVKSSLNCKNVVINNESNTEKSPEEQAKNSLPKLCELIDLCTEDNDDSVIEISDVKSQDTVDSSTVDKSNDPVIKKLPNGDSDEDLELLRQHALKTKGPKSKGDVKQPTDNKPFNLSDDEDSDTAELRLICLKSALLKKAIEMKQKQKQRKRLSQSFHEDFDLDPEIVSNKADADNNTDIESVDMEIGSEDEKVKDISDNCNIINETKQITEAYCIIPKTPQKDEIDDDEDLLRAKLLTSLSKNWPNLVDPNVIESVNEVHSPETPVSTVPSKVTSIPEAKPFIIKLGESDSEGEHEATKNLTKMHMKLSEQVDFQQKLDLFLKSTRMEVEKQTLPDVVQKAPEQPKPAPKFVAKTVRHLPKSEQIEYKNLVRRMAELEKIKQARQTSMNLSKANALAKDTLKPRNVSIETRKVVVNHNLEQQIAVSRKKIAEESAKMLKLKDEATKLSQKYKIAATELRNISTAITLNKKEQKSIQNRLAKIRLQHQTLLKSSTSNNHSKTISTPAPLISQVNKRKILPGTKLQKENNPSTDDYKNPEALKSVKVSVVNDLSDDVAVNKRLSIQVDVSGNNKKVVKITNSPTKEKVVDVAKHRNNKNENLAEEKNPTVEKGGGNGKNCTDADNDQHNAEKTNKVIDDYKSPLDALNAGSWAEDPNSFLCPFEVGGTCKDPDCKYLHPKIPSKQ
ncbi:uncharacterized protein LOC135073356 isoform X1 [Ostrinia nubilalis]|uniref:uncharacterized protein LOC135073356 isoform X1 n=1 Tax=Ostrinia nubilalis TaxID=29057 RepID=UPI0030824067